MRIERVRPLMAAAAALTISAFFLFVPPIAQEPGVSFFRGYPHALGHSKLLERGLESPVRARRHAWAVETARRGDRVLFTGVLLTFFGSAYYHLAPSDARLVWDRLPMTLVFMALLACVVKASNSLLAIFLACGVASVLWWNITGDLRFYALVQFGPLLILIPALWFVRDARYLISSLDFLRSRQARRILRSRGLLNPASQRSQHQTCPGRHRHLFHFSLARRG